jgi:serine/threonine-protein kinase HipA
MHERHLTFAMTIGGDNGVYSHRNTWPAAARDLGLDPDALLSRVRELGALIPDVVSDAARAPDVEELGRELPNRLVDLVADRAARCMRVMA